MIDKIEVEFIVELWETVRTYVPVKEREDAADAFVEIFDTYGLTDSFDDNEFIQMQMPKELKKVIKERFSMYDETSSDSDYED